VYTGQAAKYNDRMNRAETAARINGVWILSRITWIIRMMLAWRFSRWGRGWGWGHSLRLWGASCESLLGVCRRWFGLSIWCVYFTSEYSGFDGSGFFIVERHYGQYWWWRLKYSGHIWSLSHTWAKYLVVGSNWIGGSKYILPETKNYVAYGKLIAKTLIKLNMPLTNTSSSRCNWIEWNKIELRSGGLKAGWKWQTRLNDQGETSIAKEIQVIEESLTEIIINYLDR
jgi:hypothetical protein